MKGDPLWTKPGRPPRFEASWKDIIWGRLEALAGRFLQFLRVPGLVQPMKFVDPGTGTRVAVVTSPYFTKVSINGREYYFDRLTGRFDGTGQ